MGVFSDDSREITCVYNSEDYNDAQTLGYLQASKKSLQAIDISKQQLTGTQWVELCSRLGAQLQDIINEKEVEGDLSNFDNDDCITILRENPKALNGAIVFTRHKAKQIQNPSTALAFIDSDTGNVSRNP
ncbi:arsenate reductase family protein [Tamlana crocina]|uniref:Uncharacterized protein n=1 Tax=Tamlana crocina TaxID=393006 RepID=A0ABX1D9M2_9FLAO|nr:hypothetical protein [Tamlana crocina]NJX15077.1 hypothetical protein [Tamlana crocina]